LDVEVGKGDDRDLPIYLLSFLLDMVQLMAATIPRMKPVPFQPTM
jgi:hypothetical protein